MVTFEPPLPVSPDAAVEDCLAFFQEGFRPPPDLTISEWADRNRILPAKSSGEHGPWRTSRAPYTREIMDELSPSSHTEDVIFMKGSQVGATEIGINLLLYIMEHTPGPTLAVEPTVDLAKKYSKMRLQPSIVECPKLREKVSENRSRDTTNTTLMKEFPGGVFIMTGANSAVGLRMLPIRFLFLDEIDGYPSDVDGEGDPVELALRRTTNFSRRKRYFVSTPTTAEHSRIAKRFAESDQRYYYVPCPHCKKSKIIKWANIKWEHEKPETTHLVCDHCGVRIEEYHKTWMLANGRWIKHNPKSKIAGFHLSALYSPVGWFSWAEAVDMHLKARGNPNLRKVWVNTVLGEVWEEENQTTVDAHWLAKRKEKYSAAVPSGVVCVTVGGDIQADRVELSAWGWGARNESWLIDHTVILGDPKQANVWQLVDQHLQTQLEHESGLMMSVAAACIDAGYLTDEVYAFCKPRAYRRVYASKGVPGSGIPIIYRVSKIKDKGVRLVLVGVDQAKDSLYGRLMISKDDRAASFPPGYVHFPDMMDGNYFEGLTAEKKVLRHSAGMPKSQWQLPSGKRNEPLDCHNYAFAAMRLLNLDLDRMAQEKRVFASDFSQIQRKKRRVLHPGVKI